MKFDEPETPTKRFRVKMLRGYFPEDPEHPKHPLTGGIEKVVAGTTVALPIDEAKRLLKAKIAELPDDYEPVS
jgi:hypothetical protein